MEEPLRRAAGKHAVVGGFVPAAWMEQADPGRGEPLLSLVLSGHPLFLARYGVVTLDLGPASRLELSLAYRKEATAAVGEDALQATLQAVRRQLRPVVPDGEPEGDGEARLLKRVLGSWDRVAVEQEGKFVRASLDVDDDLRAALVESVARAAVSSLPKLGGVVSGGFDCVTADRAVHFLKGSTPAAVLRALITRSGDEVVDWPEGPAARRGVKRSGLEAVPAPKRPAVPALPPKPVPKEDKSPERKAWR